MTSFLSSSWDASSGVVNRLTDSEKTAIAKTVESLPEGREVAGFCTYGSRIAGYAKPDSDYDVILALRGYRETVRYKYLSGEANVSALVVDSVALLADARRAALGEFVAGRFLNVYEPLAGAEFLGQVELSFKRRVVMELLSEVVASYGDFASELKISMDYFLYEKLKKRATIYPPALYSYVKTYAGPMAEENLLAARRGVAEALRRLRDEGLVLLDEGLVRIAPQSIRSGPLARLAAALTYTARGLKQYAVHGYAGRVGFEVAGKEALSKLARSKEVDRVPDELRHPRNLWRLDEGLLLVESDDWLDRTVRFLGMGEGAEVAQEHLGELYNVSRVYVVRDGTKVVKLAVKRFRDLWSVKWAFLNVWALPSKRFNLTPLARLYREYSALRALRTVGLMTPEIVAVVLGDRILVTRFVEGDDLGKIVAEVLANSQKRVNALSMYGEAMALAHAAGYSLGDTKPSNAILADSQLFLTDLEQATPAGDKAWDIAEFLYYSTKLTLNTQGARTLVRSFLEGYLKNGSAKIVAKALNLKYLAPFQPLLVPTVAKTVRDEMAGMVKGSGAD